MTDSTEPAVVELPDDVIKALVEAASGIDIAPELLARVPEAVEYVDAWRKTLIDNGSLREESPTNEFLGVVTIAATWAVNGVIAACARAEAVAGERQRAADELREVERKAAVAGNWTLHDLVREVRLIREGWAAGSVPVAGQREQLLADVETLRDIAPGDSVVGDTLCQIADRVERAAGSVPVATPLPDSRLALLGPARMVLDRCAVRENPADPDNTEAGRMAQRIVDAIGHPVTDQHPVSTPPAESAAEQLLRDIFMDPGPVATRLQPGRVGFGTDAFEVGGSLPGQPVATPTEPKPGSDQAYRLQARLQAENRLVATLHGRSDPCRCPDCAASPVPAEQPQMCSCGRPRSECGRRQI